MLKLTVPGNLLLLGEYAVIENGGMGLALAPDIRVHLDVEPEEAFGLTGIWGGNQVSWRPGDRDKYPLLSSVWERCVARLGRHELYVDGLRGGIRVDSSALYNTDGRKNGFGSSAAVSVALSTAVMLQAGLSEDVARREAGQAALEGHRLAQGGLGSGYDILTSSHGAVGLFIGGQQPTWTPLTLDWLPELYLFSGEHSVSSGRSISRYLNWKQDHPAAAERFLKHSNAEVLAFIKAGSWTEAQRYLERYRSLATELGRAIGVSAEIAPPEEFSGCISKAVGAGNELGVAFCGNGHSVGGAIAPLQISERGVVWTR